mgnify:CR=1 FL=1
MSPKYFRDQTYSEKAIEKLQEFIDDYPNSDKREKAQEDILILRDKLSHKAYESGILYMKMEEYKAAILAFKQVTDLYYDTDFVETKKHRRHGANPHVSPHAPGTRSEQSRIHGVLE